MRTFSTLCLLISILDLQGQVELDSPLRFVGPQPERQISGLGAPVSQNAAITVEASLIGTATWAVATVNGNTIALVPSAPLTAYRDGQLLRFVAPADLHGPTTLGCIGLQSFPLVRPDGLAPSLGQIRAGAIIEVILAGSKWIMMNAPERGCPSRTVSINERVCVEKASSPESLFYNAAERCTNMGGRLCGWDEYFIACTEHGAELTGTGVWEWVDDSSNHAHSAVQVGLGGCMNQRSAHPQVVTLGRSRCCFHTR